MNYENYNSANLPLNGIEVEKTDKVYYDYGRNVPLDGLILDILPKDKEEEEEETLEYEPCRVILNYDYDQNDARYDEYYLYPNEEGVACGQKDIYNLGRIKAETLDNGLELYYLIDPITQKYFYRTETKHGTNGDWTLYEIHLGDLDENPDNINRYKWYQTKKDNAPRLVNYYDSSKNASGVTSTDCGIHICNWSFDWMQYERPKVACGKGVQQGNHELSTIFFLANETKYTITWKNEDGTVLSTSTVKYGDMPSYTGETPTKESDEQYTYTFKGWTPEITSVTGDATYTATFEATLREYKIKFMNGNKVLQETTVKYGEKPAYTGETPTKTSDEQYTYTFNGWEPEISEVTGETTYSATFEATLRQYTITWKNEDGTVLSTSIINYGETPEYNGEIPTKESDEQYTYTFNVWSPSIESVTGNATYTATFVSTLREYTITWKNEDGTTLQETTVNYGETPEYNGEIPTKAEDEQYTYVFSSWTPAITAVTGEATYTAQFEATLRRYTITWKNEDGTVLETNEVNYGEKPSYTGETPTKESNAQYTYTFSSWSPEITTVIGDAIYTATFEATVRQYTIKFVNGGTTLQETTVNYGEIPTYNGETPTKESDEQFTYTFIGWTPEITAVTGNQTYTATFEETLHQYTITWKNEDGTVLSTSTVNYGQTPVYTGETPTKASDEKYTYMFNGWDPEIITVTGDTTYTAKFEAYEYIYLTDCTETPTSGATVDETTANVTYNTTSEGLTDFKFNTVSFGDVNEQTPNTQLKSTSSSKYILKFEPNLDLSNYNDVKLDVWWGASPNNNSGIKLFINNSQVGSDGVNTKDDRNKLRIITTDIDNNSIETLTLQGNNSSGAICFRIGIKGKPKEYLLTVNENEIGNIKAGEDISQYLTFEEKEGMIHKWMEGETEFIGSVMPNRDLILTSKYEDKPDVQNILYYSGVLNDNINDINSDNIKTEFEKLEFEDGEQQGIQIQLPVLDDNAAWEEYYEKEMLGEAEEWTNTYGFKYYIAIPKNSTIELTNAMGASVSLDKKENGITIEGVEYDIYLSRNSMVPTSTTDTHDLTIKITL